MTKRRRGKTPRLPKRHSFSSFPTSFLFFDYRLRALLRMIKYNVQGCQAEPKKCCANVIMSYWRRVGIRFSEKENRVERGHHHDDQTGAGTVSDDRTEPEEGDYSG